MTGLIDWWRRTIRAGPHFEGVLMNRIIDVLKTAPPTGMSSHELQVAVRISAAVFYPLIASMEQAGTVVSDWENDPARPEGPRRRLYRLPDTR